MGSVPDRALCKHCRRGEGGRRSRRRRRFGSGGQRDDCGSDHDAGIRDPTEICIRSEGNPSLILNAITELTKLGLKKGRNSTTDLRCHVKYIGCTHRDTNYLTSLVCQGCQVILISMDAPKIRCRIPPCFKAQLLNNAERFRWWDFRCVLYFDTG